MDILYLLIPLSALLVLGLLGVFAWALHSGQFEDLEREGARILDGPGKAVDVDQDPGPAAHEQSQGWKK